MTVTCDYRIFTCNAIIALHVKKLRHGKKGKHRDDIPRNKILKNSENPILQLTRFGISPIMNVA